MEADIFLHEEFIVRIHLEMFTSGPCNISVDFVSSKLFCIVHYLNLISIPSWHVANRCMVWLITANVLYLRFTDDIASDLPLQTGTIAFCWQLFKSLYFINYFKVSFEYICLFHWRTKYGGPFCSFCSFHSILEVCTSLDVNHIGFCFLPCFIAMKAN